MDLVVYRRTGRGFARFDVDLRSGWRRLVAAYYNEIDPYAAQWLRNLIKAGHIADGEVDERSIEDVRPNDLAGFTQCHFFAGIGVWSYALRLSGWPDDRPVWTGSCPCQPFSSAGKGAGFDDERHLWPAWFHLISECRPVQIFGEQVASADALDWFDLVQTDLDGANYRAGASDICAAGVGAPHIRQRLFWMAYAHLPKPNGVGASSRKQSFCDRDSTPFIGVVNSPSQQKGVSGFTRQFGKTRWDSADWIECSDGKLRPVESGTFPLAHGVASRMDKIRAYGNAIVSEAAASFVRAASEILNGYDLC